MTNQAKDCAIELISDADRASLRNAQKAWASPEMVALFADWDLKEAVLSGYKRLRKHGQDPDSALYLVLYDYGLEDHYPEEAEDPELPTITPRNPCSTKTQDYPS